MADLDLAGRTVGEFVLHGRIGAGGYGTVYLCEQPSLKRAAVVKVLHARRRRNHAAHQRFLREAHLASRLDHPYAAHVYSFGVEDDGLHWIAMELVHGITLGEWLRSRGPMTLEAFVPFFECVAQVVQAAHERGIIHRDLKPSNIMVIESGGRLFPKLLDFGIAKLSDGADASADEEDPTDLEVHDAVATARIRVTPPLVPRTHTDDPVPTQRLTRPGIVLGSAPYMSPEQWGAPYAVGPATDIYSLGCVAYEALTGRAPFTAASTGEYYDHHIRTEPPPLGDAFSPSLDRVLCRALAKSPDARHASALELASDLRAVLRAEPREQLRSSAQQWHDRARPPSLLWGRDVLTEVEHWTRSASSDALTELECSFVAASQRRARRVAWARRSLLGLAAVGTLALLQYRSGTQARLAEQQARLAEQQTRHAKEQASAAHELAEARVTESELEQGRAALLHGEPEAQAHLAEAYERDPASATAFMLARSMQPRLAEQARFASTYGRMWWATFSPDGRQIATADDRAAQIWDGQTYRLLFTLPHGCEVYQALYSADGARLVTVAQTMVRIWDARSGALLHDLKAKPGGKTASDFYRVAISPDGKFVAAMDTFGSVAQVWDADSGVLVAELRNGRAGFPRLAFSSDGWLATTGGDEARIFEVRTWRHVLTIRGPIRSLTFDTRSRLLTGTATGQVALWAIPTGVRLQQLRHFGESADAVAFSPDAQLVAAGARDGAVQVWHAGSGALRSQSNPRRSKILALEFDPTSKLLLSANGDGTVAVLDAAQGLSVSILDGPRNAVRFAQFDASSRIVGASSDGTARVWDARSPYRRWSSEPMSDDCEVVMVGEPLGRFVAIGCVTRPTRVWDTARDQLLAELPSVTPVEGDFSSAFPAVSSEGDRAAIARGTVVQVYGLPGGRLLRTIEHGSPVSAVAFAETGRAVVSGGVDGSVRVTREEGGGLAVQASGGIDAVAVLSDGRVIVSDAGRRIRVYASDGTMLADLEVPTRVISLRREGGRLLALPSYIGNPAPPLLIDLERRRLVAELDGHIGYVFSARWTSGGRIITAGADGTAKLWDGATGQLLRTYRGGSRFLADAVVTSDMVIAGDADGLLRFWDVGSGAKLWTLPTHKSAAIGVHVDGKDIVTRGFSGEISRWRLPESGEVLRACGHHIHCAIVPR